MIHISEKDFDKLRARGLQIVSGLPTNKKARKEYLDSFKNPLAGKHPDDPWSYGPYEMPGQLCSKSNSRKIVRMGNRIAVIKSAEARAYVETFLKIMPKTAVPFEGPVCFKAHVYYADRRRDLDVALIQDCLQAHGIIKNDRQVVEIHAWRLLDKERPRTSFILTRAGDV